MRVELDKKSIFALASDTRLEILKSLNPMRRTVTQLSEELKIDKGAVHRHLKKMEAGGLVKRFEDHGFVYYGLSWKARDLVAPNENTRIVVVLSSVWILSLLVVFLVAAGLMSESGNDGLMDLIPGFDESGSERSDYELGASDGSDAWVVPSAVMVVLIIALAAVTSRLLRKPKQKCPEESKGIEGPSGEPGED